VALNAEIEFVNRTEELLALRSRIPPSARENSLTFLRAPSGFGKSRLTDHLLETSPTDGPTFVVVDPAIRSKQRSDRIYPWFFVQRAAEPNAARNKSGREFRSFAEYLRRSQYARINWKHVYENLKEAFSLSKLARFTFELGENLLKTGRYSPEAILQDDGRFATQIAQEYVTQLAYHRPTVFVIRESQNIDPESLRFFLTVGEETATIAVILEYTSPDNRFSPDHEKVILDTVTRESSLIIFDLLRLDLKEFRALLQRYSPLDKQVEAAVEIAWDGNLRIIKELKYRLMLGRSVEDSKPLLATIEQNLELLPKRRRLLLAVIASNVEAIAPEVIIATAKRIEPNAASKDIVSELNELANAGQYVQLKNHIALTDEDLLEAITKSPAMQPFVRLAETSLRDFYLDVVKGAEFASLPLQTALRQAIALCARTGDIVALRGLIKILESAVQQASDQTLYINIVAGVLRGCQDFSDLEQEELVGWASAAAYEVGDFATTVSLLESLPVVGNYELAVLACGYGEVNRHEEALTLAQQLRSSASADSSTALVGKLVECANLFALDRKTEAEQLHSSMRSDAVSAMSPLFGYVLRYTEIIKDFPDCTSDVLESADLFFKHGFHKSAAYSQLAGAMHLAYSGQVAEARQLLAKAESELTSHVRDRQIVLNNSVVLELLRPEPYVEWCIEKLNSALFTVGDDFSRLTLQNNRLICFWLSGNFSQAIHCADVIERILHAPGFGNRDVFWTTCFNAWSFFNDIGDVERSNRFKSIPLFLDIDKCCYASYWKARFGINDHAGPEFDFLMQFKYHPEYLSHWLIDFEGLSLLKGVSAQ
jgi:hypothetical protein